MKQNNTHKNIPMTAIVGASGFLGHYFLLSYREFYADCVGTVRGPAKENHNIFLLDLLKPDIRNLNLSKKGYKQALICAAETKVYACEINKAATRKINVDGTLELIRQLIDEGIKPIFFSSDQVFDGKKGSYSESSPANPITEYGKQKAEVEANIESVTNGNYLVVRLSKVFSLKKQEGTFLDEIASILLSGGMAKAAFDQIFCPTLINDVIDVVNWLQVTEATGIVNVCSPETWSRYDLAMALAKRIGDDASKVKKVSLDEVMLYPKWPKNTSMISKILPKDCVTFTSINKCIEKIADNWMASKNTLLRD